jgi:hypothetical protein
MLFAVVTDNSVRMNREIRHARASRYFWWASLRLDSDPLGIQHRTPAVVPCEDSQQGCVEFQPMELWIDLGWIAKSLVLSALPAFIAEGVIILILSRFGISQISIFMFSMPLFIFAWFYFLGWLLDRWRYQRENKKTPTKA